MTEISIPAAFTDLSNREKRYIVYYGGRGGAKSVSIGRELLIRAANEKCRILCTRNLQNSIRDSVHSLIAAQIGEMGLDRHFEVQRDNIKCTLTGSDFIFKGLEHNVNEIKSLHGVKYCWVEEAQAVAGSGWKILRPTIREKGSQFFIS